jgi:hypothetical protein
MTVSVRQLTGAVVVSFCVGAFIAPVWTQVQGTAQAAQASSASAKQPTFMTVEFMQVPEGKQEDWLKLEREWKPMHALRVKDGSIQSWAAIAQAVPGDVSNGPVYATVTTYRGWPDPTKMNLEELFKKAHPQGDVNALMQQTESARRMVRTEIWQVLEQTEPRPVVGTN